MSGWRRAARILILIVPAIVALALPAIAAAQPPPNASPTGGVVVAGSATIATSPSTTTIDQASQRAAVNWQSFDVGSQQAVTFQQPSASAVTLVRVNAANATLIAGRINANGQVIIVNQAGVAFDVGAQVDDSSMLVIAAGISNANFMAGNLVFDGPAKPNAAVSNRGVLTVKQAGLLALVAPVVANSGQATASLGHIVMAAATTADLNLYGNGLLSLNAGNQVTQVPIGANGKPVTALVKQTGSLTATGGTIQLTAGAAAGVIQTLVSNTGRVLAPSAGGVTGSIHIDGVGGSIAVGGKVKAVGTAPGSTGGTIELLPTATVSLGTHASVNASGRAGGGTIAVGTDLARAIGGPSVAPTAESATVTIPAGAALLANATGNGNGGRITMLSTVQATMAGTVSATGGPNGGNGGFVELSSNTVVLNGTVDVSAPGPGGSTGTFLLDPRRLIL